MKKSLQVTTGESSQPLCRSCAMCCNGTLFSCVPLDPSEVEPMRKFGFYILNREEKSYFAQPCLQLHDSDCSIYEGRPQNCRGFRCRVLRRLENGELTLEAARVLVKKATELLATIHRLLPNVGNDSWSIWKRLDAFAEEEKLAVDSVEFSSRHSTLGTHLVVLKKLLESEFHVQS